MEFQQHYFDRVVFGEDQVARLTQAGVQHLPEIHRENELVTELTAQVCAISFDTEAIVDGMLAAGLRNHIEVTVIGKEATEEAEPTFVFENHRDHVICAIDSTPTEAEHSEHLANVGFWTSAISSNIIGEPESAQEHWEEICKHIRHTSLAINAGSYAFKGAAGAISLAVFLTGGGLAIPAFIIAGMKGVGSGINFVADQVRHKIEDAYPGSELFKTELAEKVASVAEDVAAQYPVISYDADIDIIE